MSARTQIRYTILLIATYCTLQAGSAVAQVGANPRATQASSSRPKISPGQVIDIKGLTKAQIRTLPADQLVLFKGKQTTKKQARAALEQRIKALQATGAPKAKAEEEQDQAEFAAHFKQLDERRKSRILAENSKIRTQLNRLAQSGALSDKSAVADISTAMSQDSARKQIEAEARELYRRAQQHPNAQQLAAIEKRAGELLMQLQAELLQKGAQLPIKK